MKLYLKRMCAYAVDLLITAVVLNIFLFSYQVFQLDPQMAVKGNYMLLCAVLSILFLFIYIPTKQKSGHNARFFYFSSNSSSVILYSIACRIAVGRLKRHGSSSAGRPTPRSASAMHVSFLSIMSIRLLAQ